MIKWATAHPTGTNENLKKLRLREHARTIDRDRRQNLKSQDESNIRRPSMTEIVTSTMMMVYLMILLSFMINLMTTRAAVFALHVPVMKGGTTACFFHETCIVSVGGQQLSTNDDLLLRTWDVWLWKKSRTASEIDYMGIGNKTARYRNLDISRKQSRRNLIYPNNED